MLKFSQRYFAKGRGDLYKYLSQLFSEYSSKMLGFPILVTFKLLPQRNPSVGLLGNFIIRKLYYRFRLSQILNPIIKGINRNSLMGMRINTSGRFTRAQRASHSSTQFGRVPLNNYSLNINYLNRTIPLKYGVCSVKIWMCYKSFSKQTRRAFFGQEREVMGFIFDCLPKLDVVGIEKNKIEEQYTMYIEGRKKKYLAEGRKWEDFKRKK
jgi:hypothetical protein